MEPKIRNSKIGDSIISNKKSSLNTDKCLGKDKLKLTFDNIEIEVTKKHIKNIYLSVCPPNGEVRISAPKGLKDEDIKQFAISKLSWIKKQKSKFENQKRFVENEFISGELHYYLGKGYLLNVVYQASNRSKVEIKNQKFINLYVNENSSKEKREKVMKEWYRKELKKFIPPLLEKWEDKIGVHTKDWGIKQMKTRWGTCNITDKKSGSILNWPKSLYIALNIS